VIVQSQTEKIAWKYAAPMGIQPDPYESLLAEYTAAMAQELADWTVAKDTSLGPVERVKEYAPAGGSRARPGPVKEDGR
jgi:hypothetical protein